MRRILVTGAGGFIGRRVVQRLARDPENEIFALSRSGAFAQSQTVDSVDLLNHAEIERWAARRIGNKRLDAIAHLAAVVPSKFHGAEADASFAMNVRMTEAVVSLARLYRSRVVYASSSAVYGTRPTPPITEDSPIDLQNAYARGKSAGEEAVAALSREIGVPSASLRIVAPYGPGQRLSTVIRIFVDAALSGRDLVVHGAGDRTQDFTFVDDVAEAFCLALQRETIGAFNISGGHPVTMLQLAQLVISCIGSTSSKVRLGEVPDSQGDYRGIFSTDKARSELDFVAQTSLENGVARLAAERRVTA